MTVHIKNGTPKIPIAKPRTDERGEIYYLYADILKENRWKLMAILHNISDGATYEKVMKYVNHYFPGNLTTQKMGRAKLVSDILRGLNNGISTEDMVSELG